MDSKALLAVVFAGSMLNAHVPAACANIAAPVDRRVEHIENPHLSPEVRAYYLLKLAECYLNGTPDSDLDASFLVIDNTSTTNWLLRKPSRGPSLLELFARRASGEPRLPWDSGRIQLPTVDQPTPVSHNLDVANAALEKALAQMSSASTFSATLPMYFIASKLYLRAGNSSGEKKCQQQLKRALASCEKPSSYIDEQGISAAVYVADLMANQILRVRIPEQPLSDLQLRQQMEGNEFTESAFRACEKLKKQGVSIADQLPADNHIRRLAHRNLALWYKQLGREEQAESEKQILYKLVGINDERILYPQTHGCGTLVWWTTEQGMGALCGMG